MTKTRAFEFIGLQVKCEKNGQTFIGDVKDATPIETDFNLYVKHFNGEPWPFSPLASEVEILGPGPMTPEEQKGFLKALKIVYGD